MPPKADKKTKEKPVKGAEAEQMVLAYMKATNRPYSSNDVSTNLKDRVAKAEAARVLTSLTEKGQVTSKAYGKQTIFVYNQSLLDVLSPEEMAVLEAKAKESKEELDERKKELRSIQNELNVTLSTPKTADLAKAIQEIKASNEKLVKALAAYRGESAAPPMTVEEMNRIDKDWSVWRKAWTERKKTYREAIGILQEGNVIGGKLADWEEEQGIEPEDEEATAVENGEFVKVPPRSQPNKSKMTAGLKSSALGKRPRAPSASTTSSKRSGSGSSA